VFAHTTQIIILVFFSSLEFYLLKRGIMWHEARKQEKKIRGLLVDYQRRAQRRKDYYEKIVSDFCFTNHINNSYYMLFIFRKLILHNFYNYTAVSVKYTLIQGLQLPPIVLLLCKRLPIFSYSCFFFFS